MQNERTLEDSRERAVANERQVLDVPHELFRFAEQDVGLTKGLFTGELEAVRIGCWLYSGCRRWKRRDPVFVLLLWRP